MPHIIAGVAPMPVSAVNSQIVYDALKACGVRIVSALPETWLVHLSGWRSATAHGPHRG